MTNENENLRPLHLNGIPFAWQDRRTMGLIRANYTKKKLTTAIAIYQTLTELASATGGKNGKHTNKFFAHLSKIAAGSGKSISTIKRYAIEFKKLSILSWKNKKNGKMNLPNLWELLDYSVQNNEPTSNHNKKSNPSNLDNDPVIKELKEIIYNKNRSKNFRTNNNLTSIGKILEKTEHNF